MPSSAVGKAVPSHRRLVVLLGAAATALATADHWFSGTLVQGYGYASTAAHSISYPGRRALALVEASLSLPPVVVQ